MNKNDLRYIKTDRLIVETFLDCVDDEGFDKVTVSMICDRALISRNTFYSHYEDKYTLIKSIYEQFENKALEEWTDKHLVDMCNGNFLSGVQWTFDFMDRNKNAVRVLIKASRQDFYGIIERVFVDMPLAAVCPTYNPKASAYEIRQSKAFMINATIGFIEAWVNQSEDTSVDRAYKLYTKLSNPGEFIKTILQ